jgi:hypothetical protein
MPQIGCLSFCATVFDSESPGAVLNPNFFERSNLLSPHHLDDGLQIYYCYRIVLCNHFKSYFDLSLKEQRID